MRPDLQFAKRLLPASMIDGPDTSDFCVKKLPLG